MTKMTYANALETIMTRVNELAQNANVEGVSTEVTERLEALLAQLQKRSTADRKPSKAQKENAVTAEALFTEMVDGTAYTVTEAIATLNAVNGMSTQKVTPLFRALVNAGKVAKTTEKGKTFYSKVAVAE